MRINDVTESYFDILWFAHDTAGNILVAQSLGSGIPGLAECDEERTVMIAERLSGLKAIDRERSSEQENRLASRLGFYHYIADDPYE